MTDSAVLMAADKLFQARGYHQVTEAEIAAEAAVAAVIDKHELLIALLDKYNPRQALKTLLHQSQAKTAEDMVRQTFVQLIAVLDDHPIFLNYALVDMQMNNASYLTSMTTDLALDGVGFINRLSKMPDMRPISPIMLGRAFAALVIGFVATGQFAPRPAQFAMRLFPHRAWVEGMVDIFLYGILETE